MKFIFLAFIAVLSVQLSAQTIKEAESGITYGSVTTAAGAISVAELEKHISNNRFDGKISGKVVEVCQEKGCWMKVQRSNGEQLMVKFKDYGFFMPKNIVGKEVVLDGEATVKEVSVKQQKHYAEDAGKTKDEIALIKKPKKELQFIAKGVLVL